MSERQELRPDLTNDVHTAVNLNDWASDENTAGIVLIVVVRAALINVRSAAVLLGLAGRHSAITPSRLLPVTPSRRAAVTVTIAASFVTVATFPALVVIVIEMFVAMLVFLTLVPMICH